MSEPRPPLPDRLLDSVIRVFAHLADRPGRLLAVCLALNAIFLPYTGIDNDAILYAFQVVNAGSGRFDGDLFFRYGNQGAYTLVPALLAGPAEQFGPAPVFAVVYLLANAARLAATQWLVFRLLGRSPAVAAGLLLDAIAPVLIGCLVIGANETFVTARLPAVALATAGLDRLLAGRWRSAAGLLALGMVAHPLMGLPGVLVAVGWVTWNWADTTRRQAGVIAVGATGWAVALGMVAFAGTLDPEWRGIVLAHNRCINPVEWLPTDWLRLTVAAGCAGVVAWELPDRRAGRMLALIPLVGGVGLITSVAAAQGTSGLLFFGQPYRWLWLLEVLRWPVGLVVVARLWAAGPAGRLAGVALFGVLTAGPDLFRPESLIALAIGGVTAAVADRLCGTTDTSLWRPTAGGLGLGSLVWLVGLVVVRLVPAIDDGAFGRLALPDQMRVIQDLVAPLPRLLAAAAILALAARVLPGRQLVPVGLAVWLVASTVAASAHLARPADQTPTTAFVRRVLAERWSEHRPPTVYWPSGRVERVWHGVGANCYFNLWQMAPSGYFRGLAIEGTRRWRLVVDFEIDRIARDLGPHAWLISESKYAPAGPPPAAAFRAVAAEPGLDFVVLPCDYGGAVATNGSVWVYDCRKDRSLAAAKP